MRRALRPAICLAASLAAALPALAAPQVGDARLRPIAFAELSGWAADDHAAAFRTFRRSCAKPAAGSARLVPAATALAQACAAAARLPASLGEDAARTFFEQHFTPHEVVPVSGRGFLTGYFEPEYEGSLTRSADYPVPMLAAPPDLVPLKPGEAKGALAGLTFARRTAQGLQPYPDRHAIETGALGDTARPLLYLRSPAEAFVVHVQGSSRIRLPDGRVVRLAFAAKNGQPYTSIGKLLVERGEVPLAEMNLERLTGWLKAHPQAGERLMRENRSFIFFRLASELDPKDGPIGGAGLPLTPGRSLAVDRHLWRYGLPIWLQGELPRADGSAEPLGRLMVAQDTGTAIVGPARGDFFFGAGREAGTRAGWLRHPVRFVVLLPNVRAAH